MRLLVVDMAALLEIELGVLVATSVQGIVRVAAGVLPANRYATLVYTGVENGIAANAALQEWAARQGIVWQKWATERGDGGARASSGSSRSRDEADPAKWETELAYLVAT